MTTNRRFGPLLGLTVGLGAVLAFELMAGPFFLPEASSVSPIVKNPLVSTRDPPPTQPNISTFSEIVARPLFAESRRPLSKSEEKVAADERMPETFDLIGVVISADGRIALLRTLSTNEVTRAVEGQSLGGWEVSDIKPTQVVLRRGEESEVVKIDAAPPPPMNNPSAVSPPIDSTNADEAGSPVQLSRDSSSPSLAMPPRAYGDE